MDHLHKHLPKHQIESESLTVGPQQPLLYQNLNVHPVKTMQENQLQNTQRQQLQQLSVLHGSHMAMRYVMDANIMSSTRRLGGYGSNMHGLNMHLDRYEDLDEFDILNNPYESPDLDKVGVHAHMEKLYGI